MIGSAGPCVGLVTNRITITQGASPFPIGMDGRNCSRGSTLPQQNHNVSETSHEQYEHGETGYRNTSKEMSL